MSRSIRTPAEHARIVAGDTELSVRAVRYHQQSECLCLYENGRSASPAPSSPPCLHGGCPLTLAGHEVVPPKAGTYHWEVWWRQVRSQPGEERFDGWGGRWWDCAVGRVWAPE